MSAANETLDIGENSESIAPTPKRRGRKRKSEITAPTAEKSEAPAAPKEKTVSRRGRPRKKVNYFELANPENSTAELPTPLDKVHVEENDETINSRKRKNLSASEIADEGDDLTLGHSEIDNNSSVIRDNEHEDSNVKENEDQIHLEQNKIEEEASTSTPKGRDKRYNYTGETVKMMNTLFTMFNNKTDDDSFKNSTDNDSILKNSNNNGKRIYRKRKHSSKNDKDIDNGTDTVTCAICNCTLNKSVWLHHKQRYHNNLAWRVGDEPLDLSDQSLVMYTLNMLYKKKKPLYCDKCGEFKKSVVGFLSHRSQCLKSDEQLESVKVACEICGRKTLPVSMSTHMKIHQSQPEQEQAAEKSKKDINKPVSSKRSAAKKALRMIEDVTKNDLSEDRHFTTNLNLEAQEFAKELLQKYLDESQFIECVFKCNTKCTTLEDALKHFEECPEKLTEGFLCKVCLFTTLKLEDMIYHIESVHEISVDGEEEFDVDEKETKLPGFLISHRGRWTDPSLFSLAFQWTFSFCEENFSERLLQDSWFTNSKWPLLSPESARSYLPTMNESCDVAYTHVNSFINPLHENYTFKKYRLFQSEVHEDNKITLFCGGPVVSVAWLPTPYTKDDANQILAVSVLNSPDEKYFTYDNYNASSAIQFWDFGRLKNKQASLSEPKLAFSVAHDHGPVWHMEWCPSGCHEEDKERLGALAVTGSDSVVYVYAVPSFTEEVGLFYKPKPAIKLLLQRPESPLLGGVKYYPTRISWSKASDHQHLAVGYTNGFVAIFNLTSNSPILKFQDSDGVVCVLPIKCFQGHSHSITALALYHLNGGCRWLMTGSLDRGVCLWDLDDYSYPIHVSKRNIITDGFWFTNWLCHLVAPDEGSTAMHVTTIMKQARDYLSDVNVTMTCSTSTISSISGSDWLNGMLHANTVGEIFAIFPHQMLHLADHYKQLKCKRLLFGYTCLVEKSKTPARRVEEQKIRKKVLQNLVTKKASAGVKLSMIKSDYDYDHLFLNESVTYDVVEEKYGLLFCDNRMESHRDFPKTTSTQLSAFSKDYSTTCPNQYPLTTVNKIVFNPNRQASLYYATGYQAGFVRLSWMGFLKHDQQIK